MVNFNKTIMDTRLNNWKDKLVKIYVYVKNMNNLYNMNVNDSPITINLISQIKKLSPYTCLPPKTIQNHRYPQVYQGSVGFLI